SGADGDDVGRLRNDGGVSDGGDKGCDVGGGERVWLAGRAAGRAAGAPIVRVIIWQVRIDQLEGTAQAVMRRVPFPPEVSVSIKSIGGQHASGPVAIVAKMDGVKVLAAAVIQLDGVARERP